MIAEPPICMWCKHFHRSGHLACDAFPEGIPEAIWYHQDDQIQPFPGDHGIQFELDEEVRLPSYLRVLLRTRVGSR